MCYDGAEVIELETKTTLAVNATELKSQNLILECSYFSPNVCPVCHYGVEPLVLNAYYTSADQSSNAFFLFLILRCPHCGELFLSKFSGVPTGRRNPQLSFETHLSSVPCAPNKSIFSEGIRVMSPNFVEIYTQAQSAEEMNYLALCGCGYRKSLEFLIKDYLCKKHPSQTEQIKSEPLGKSIGRVDDIRIKTLAERSAWIGNDEVHYVRKHTNLDVDQMKRFIVAAVSYIEAELALEAASAILPK